MGGSIKGLGGHVPPHILGFCVLILVLKCQITIYLKKCPLLLYSAFGIVVVPPLKSQGLGFKTHLLQFFFFFVNRAPYI